MISYWGVDHGSEVSKIAVPASNAMKLNRIAAPLRGPAQAAGNKIKAAAVKRPRLAIGLGAAGAGGTGYAMGSRNKSY